MSIIVVHCPACGEGRHRVDVGPEDPRVDNYGDGTGYPGYPPESEILDSTCDCADEDEEMVDRICDLAVMEESAWGGGW